MIRPSDVRHLDEFFQHCAATIYPEPANPFPAEVSQRMWLWFLNHANGIPNKPVILDLGCADGFAMEMFRAAGCLPIGVTASREEREACESKDLCCYLRDMHSIWDLPKCDLVWARHVAEHSPAPLYLLRELYHLLNSPGYLYLEVPAPDTSSRHQENANHWSVLGRSMWEQLIVRAGFLIESSTTIGFSTALGSDQYWAWACSKA